MSKVADVEKAGLTDRTSPSLSCTLQPRQKRVIWRKDLLRWFNNGGQLVVDRCAGTFAPVKTCILLPKHGQFVGGEVDRDCFGESQDKVGKVFAREMLKEESDIRSEEAVQMQRGCCCGVCTALIREEGELHAMDCVIIRLQ